MTRWAWRGQVALLAVALAFVIYPVIERSDDVINSDWPAFATGARVIVQDPSHLYNFDVQRRVELQVTGGRSLVTLGIHGILPFLAPAWVALIAIPFELLGTDIGGRLWILFGLACLGAGIYLAVRPRSPSEVLPAFATVPTALMLLNAQIDGFVALGLGAAVALWSRPYLAGLALGLTLMKPQLVLPAGLALILARRWKVLVGWATAGLVLWAVTSILSPHWSLDWLGAAGSTVQPGSREVDLPHLGVLLGGLPQTLTVGTLTLVGLAAVLLLARRRATELRPTAAVLIAGGVLASPHALPADMVLVALALAVWGEAEWFDWLILSAGAVITAFTPAPIPAFAGVLTIGWVCLRSAGVVTWRQPEPVSASAQ